jgi:Holliday junction DNA helicase RuvA
MIARLKGILDEIGDDWAIIDVGGVGYFVFCPGKTLQGLQKIGESVVLHIETHVREDHIHLYGFLTGGEKEWFGRLLNVQGVGAKVALAILSVLTPAEIGQAIAAQDKTMIGRANGVGPKLATRIVTELKDKVSAFEGFEASPAVSGKPSGGSLAADAVSALVNLGYKRAEAVAATNKAVKRLGEDAGVQALIPEALRELA